MTQKKKQENQQNTEATLQEDPLAPITVFSVKDSTSLGMPPGLAADVGYIVPCGICKQEVWAPFQDDNAVWLCGICAETIPD